MQPAEEVFMIGPLRARAGEYSSEPSSEANVQVDLNIYLIVSVVCQSFMEIRRVTSEPTCIVYEDREVQVCRPARDSSRSLVVSVASNKKNLVVFSCFPTYDKSGRSRSCRMALKRYSRSACAKPLPILSAAPVTEAQDP